MTNSSYVAPTKNGKTFSCIKYIQQRFENTIHIVFTMNTLIGIRQFANRVVNTLSCSESEICILSSKNTKTTLVLEI